MLAMGDGVNGLSSAKIYGKEKKDKKISSYGGKDEPKIKARSPV